MPRPSGSPRGPRGLTVNPARGPIGRVVSIIDGWIHFSVRVSRWPGAWVLIHRLLSVPLLLRQPVAEATVAPGLRIRCLGRPARFEGLLDDEPRRSQGVRLLSALGSGSVGDAPLEAREIHPWAAGRFRRSGWTLLPDFVRYRAAAGDMASPPFSKSLASDLRGIDRRGYAVSVAPRGRGAWRRFRQRMSEPYALRRFGPGAWLPPPPTWARLRLHGRLLTVRRDGDPVAGGVTVRARDEMWFAALGVLDGDPALIREKALAATYRAACDLARATGVAVLDSGRCSGWADDPVGWYKKKWGLRPAADPLAPLVAVRAATPAAARWLAALPRYAIDPHGALVPAATARQASGPAGVVRRDLVAGTPSPTRD